MIRQSASQYKLYLTGRRFCKFAEATLKLRQRQDLFSLLIGLIYPLEDQLDVEVYMKESNMPQMVMAITNKKLMKAMLKEDSGEDGISPLCSNPNDFPMLIIPEKIWGKGAVSCHLCHH